jgi:hypothetical protein
MSFSVTARNCRPTAVPTAGTSTRHDPGDMLEDAVLCHVGHGGVRVACVEPVFEAGYDGQGGFRVPHPAGASSQRGSVAQRVGAAPFYEMIRIR